MRDSVDEVLASVSRAMSLTPVSSNGQLDRDARVLRVDPVALLYRLGSQHNRIVTRAELLTRGASEPQIKRLLRARLMHRTFAGIYVVGVPELDQPALRAAGLALGRAGAMASHRTAAEIRGHLRVVIGEVHILSSTDGAVGTHTSEVAMAGTGSTKGEATIHASESRLPSPHFVDGWPVTPTPRTLVDVAAIHGPVVLSWAWDEAEYRSDLDPVAIKRELDGRRAPGNQAVRTLLHESFPATRPGDEIESKKELAIARLIQAAGLPHPVFNAWVSAGNDRYRLDVHYPGVLAVEVDGPHHDLQRRNARDKDRDAALLAVGIPVIHFTTAKIESDLARCRDQLLRAYAYWASRLGNPST